MLSRLCRLAASLLRITATIPVSFHETVIGTIPVRAAAAESLRAVDCRPIPTLVPAPDLFFLEIGAMLHNDEIGLIRT